MKIIGAVYCHHLDQDMIYPFRDAWTRVNPDIELVIMSDQDSPVSVCHGLKQIPARWPKRGAIAPRVIESLASLAVQESADWVIKLDVDCLHLRNRWRSGMEDSSVHVVGMRHTTRRDSFWGACWGARRDLLCRAALYGGSCRIREEDVGAASIFRALLPEEAIRLADGLCYGPHDDMQIDPRSYLLGDLIHCGQIELGQPWARKSACKEMTKLSGEMPALRDRYLHKPGY